jgi:hypothetical protein
MGMDAQQVGLPFRGKRDVLSGKCGKDTNGVRKIMSRLTWIQRVYWTRFSKPLSDRELVRHLIATPISSLLEVGVGDGSRLKRIAQLVQLKEGVDKLRYVGVDEFEAAQDQQQHLSLKTAHQLASQLNFKATLIPGDLKSALQRVAHKIGPSDLVIINGGLDPAQPEVGPVANWLNHLAQGSSTIFACAQPGELLVKLSRQSTAQKLSEAA